MPSVSKKQHNFMAMVANNPKMAKKVGIKPSVGKDFLEADKGRRFGTGGSPNITMGSEQMVNKHETRMGSEFGYKKNVPNVSNKKYQGMKGGGMAKMEMKESKSEERMEEAKDKKQDIAMIKKAFKEHDAQEHKGGKGTKITLKKGGSVKGDGIATKGKTKGRMV